MHRATHCRQTHMLSTHCSLFIRVCVTETGGNLGFLTPNNRPLQLTFSVHFYLFILLCLLCCVLTIAWQIPAVKICYFRFGIMRVNQDYSHFEHMSHTSHGCYTSVTLPKYSQKQIKIGKNGQKPQHTLENMNTKCSRLLSGSSSGI